MSKAFGAFPNSQVEPDGDETSLRFRIAPTSAAVASAQGSGKRDAVGGIAGASARGVPGGVGAALVSFEQDEVKTATASIAASEILETIMGLASRQRRGHGLIGPPTMTLLPDEQT
jgi:chorismate synthase